MNQALELAGKTLSACATDETWGNWPSVQDGQKSFLGHLGRTHFVRMGKVVAGGGRGPGCWTVTRIASAGHHNVVESDAMGELRVDNATT